MEEKVSTKKNQFQINLKVILIVLSIAFIFPSIVYILSGRSIYDLKSSFTFFFTAPTRDINMQKVIGTFLFAGLFIGIAVVYFMILKNSKKLFKKDSQVAKFILGISVIFFAMLPLTSTDIFYYIGTGWSESHYGVNPYYTSVYDVTQKDSRFDKENPDLMLMKMPNVWKNSTIVYGPVWPFVCKILTTLSMGNLPFALFIFKLFNLIIHLINCYLIYRITNKKKVFVLMYGLNPLILFDGLSNVHNDMLVIFLILLALYFLIKKKKLLPMVVFLGLATAVKYYAILLIPFLILYYYRKEKPSKKILYSCGWALVFLSVIIASYLLYMRDFQVLKGILTQQNKFMNSIYLVIALFVNVNTASLVSKGAMLAFIIVYGYTILKLLFTKEKITFTNNIRIYNVLLLIFIFGTITNFQSWYILWLLPTMFWQRGKDIRRILTISIAVELANVVFFMLFEWFQYGKYYHIAMIALIYIANKIDVNKIGKTGELINEKSKE